MFYNQIRTIKNLISGNKGLLPTTAIFVAFLAFGSVFVSKQFLTQSTDNRSSAARDYIKDRSGGDGFSWSLDQVNFADVFRIYSGFPSVTDSFGAYALKSSGDSLFVGLSADMPITSDGAMLAKVSPKEVKPIRVSYLNAAGRVTEQGIHSLFLSNDQSYLVIPGSDPCCGDDWSYGNVYTHDLSTDTLYKYRDTAKLENVVHFWGITETPGGLFGVVSSYYEGLGDWGTAGEIFASADRGKTWSRVTKDPHQYINDPSQLLSTYRITDISWFNNRIYIVNGRDGETNEPAIEYTENFGKTWSRFPEVIGDERPRMQVFNSMLVGMKKNRRDFFVIDQANTIHTVQFRYQNQLQAAANVFQVFTVANNYLFVITQDGMVLKTNNPLEEGNWEMVAAVPGIPTAIEYWPARRVLAVATSGGQGKIFEIDPNTVITPTPRPTTPPTSCLACSDPKYDHNADGVINDQDSLWFANNCLGRPTSDSCPDLNQSGGLFNSGDILCVVGCFSAPTPTGVPVATATPIPTATPTIVPTNTPIPPTTAPTNSFNRK
ncbi:hypothetical protein KC921_04180 [Candidatus Woesebacteria bacterium]|nr:hypothetical protein [Candidatus Woesebacteria bacterium]